MCFGAVAKEKTAINEKYVSRSMQETTCEMELCEDETR
jgi:hypothetical protein